MEKGPQAHKMSQEERFLQQKQSFVSFKKHKQSVSPKLNVVDILVY